MSSHDGGDMELTIEPRGSRFLLFSNDIGTPLSCDSLASLVTTDDNGEVVTSLNDDWVIFFPGMGDSLEQSLFDWTSSDINGVKYFSGTATYTNNFSMTRKQLKKGKMFLHLGNVKNMATVRINDKEFPCMWKAPFTLDITSALHEGENEIVIDVTNLWANRMIGDEQEPDDIEWSEPLVYEYVPGNPVAGRYMTAIPDWLRNGTQRPSQGRKTVGCFKFFTKNSPLLPSGLLGPVEIRVME